jgi:trimethyllysine dioxygenase
LAFKDTAYTNEFLGAHTDNTYFTDPARLQLFHLLSHENGDGGASLLVDGFRAAKILAEENPGHAKTLRRLRQPAHASGNENHCITPQQHYPVFDRHIGMPLLFQIRWNNYDRSIKWDWSVDEQYEWYEAARHFDEILRRPDMEIWTQLEPGTALSVLLRSPSCKVLG